MFYEILPDNFNPVDELFKRVIFEHVGEKSEEETLFGIVVLIYRNCSYRRFPHHEEVCATQPSAFCAKEE
jgi:hypothetical protein